MSHVGCVAADMLRIEQDLKEALMVSSLENSMEKTGSLYAGIFWFIDSELFCVRIPCDAAGNIDASSLPYAPNAKNGDTYNHERRWEQLNDAVTRGYRWNYWPRGRVQIRRGRAAVYLNPAIAREPIIAHIVAAFGLEGGGISSVRIIPDGSRHYQCGEDEIR